MVSIVQAPEGKGCVEAEEAYVVPLCSPVDNVFGFISADGANDRIERLAIAKRGFESSLNAAIQVGKGRFTKSEGEDRSYFIQSSSETQRASRMRSRRVGPDSLDSVPCSSDRAQPGRFLETLGNIPCLTSLAQQQLSKIVSTRAVFSERETKDQVY